MKFVTVLLCSVAVLLHPGASYFITSQEDRPVEDVRVSDLVEQELQRWELQFSNKLDEMEKQVAKRLDAVTRQIHNQYFDIVDTPSCEITEKAAKLQVPSLDVYCEDKAFGGGWLVIQQRIDGTLNFTRSWLGYRVPFGTVGKDSEFWIGLEAIHYITSSADYELIIEMKTDTGSYGYARYPLLRIAGEIDKYRADSLIRISLIRMFANWNAR